MNQGILRYLNWDPQNHQPLVASPESVKDPYSGQGGYPDIVLRVWNELGGSLPLDCRYLVYGSPVLDHQADGVILAVCNGTEYNLRLTPANILEAMANGIRTTTRWSDDREMDARPELGEGWIFGGWSQDEIRWCKNTFESLEKKSADMR
jgi:hypothetical protein